MGARYRSAYLKRGRATGAGPLTFVAASEGRKGDGLDLRMNGARLDRYLANPVVDWGHVYTGRDSLPIGKAVDVRTRGPQLLADVVFDRQDEFAAAVERKYRDGVLNAVSIGFDVLETDSRDPGVVTAWELWEISAVPLPADPEALVASERVALGRLGRELLATYDPDVQLLDALSPQRIGASRTVSARAARRLLRTLERR